jgi:hypothetical protein
LVSVPLLKAWSMLKHAAKKARVGPSSAALV